tara:strand:- start:87 stop:713 length:627 start_codon:yes stop_codon:yes gene_type:complete
MGTRSSLAKLSRELYPGLEAIDQNLVSLDNLNTYTVAQKFVGNTGLVPGTGISAVAGAHTSWKEFIGNQIQKTSILIDLVGLASSDGANDIIGKDGGVANCHIGQYTVATCGTLDAIKMSWLELAAGGDPDINLCSADEATLAENTALSAGTNPVTIINGGDGTATDNTKLAARTLATADQYLYLSNGAATNAAYTAGRLLIELWGTV